MPRRLALALCALVLMAAACGEATVEELASPSPSPTPVTQAVPTQTPDPDPATPGASTPPSQAHEDDRASDDDGAADAEADDSDRGAALEPVGRFSAEDRESEDFPSLEGDVALLTDVRVAAQDGFDRVVLEFDGEDVPSHRIAYVDPPITEDGSGHEVTVDGTAFLELRLTPAAGVDLSGEQAEPTYEGPDRVEGPDTVVVTEVVRTGDFEANLAWVVGLEHPAPFSVEWLTDPLRLVVDIEA